MNALRFRKLTAEEYDALPAFMTGMKKALISTDGKVLLIDYKSAENCWVNIWTIETNGEYLWRGERSNIRSAKVFANRKFK